jgi:hypothetical protein|eukprot:COSAG01_NODE_805_length_13443_cov_81.464928_18_plen_75_part_00
MMTCVSARAAGHQVEFFSSTGRSRSYPFQVLEETVVRLMRDFSSTAGRIHAALQDLAAGEPDDEARVLHSCGLR